MGQWTKNRAKTFFPSKSSTFKFPQRGDCRVRARRWSSWKPCPSSQSWIPGGCWAAPMAVFLEVIQKLPGPVNLFLSQIISLAKTLTSNCTLIWGRNGCQRWTVWESVDAAACSLPFLTETTFEVLATNMDQGCLLHFTNTQSSHRPTCPFLKVTMCCPLHYCGGLTEKRLPSLMCLNTWYPICGVV